MKLLGIVASRRKRGNSETLVKVGIEEMKKIGGEGEIIYLKHYNIKECEGCMRCVFKGEECHLQDDTYKFFEKITTASGVLLVSPTYVLTIPGELKLVMDKYLLVQNYYQKIYPRPAISVGVGGLEDWNHLLLPLMNLFLVGLGFRLVDSFFIRGAGPGEVLLDERGIERLKEGIKKMKNWKLTPFKGGEYESCPVCFTTIFERKNENTFVCPVCRVEGKGAKGRRIYFSEDTLNNHRWTPPNVEDHFENWIKKTKKRYKTLLKEIIKRRIK